MIKAMASFYVCPTLASQQLAGVLFCASDPSVSLPVSDPVRFRPPSIVFQAKYGPNC